MKQLAFLFFLLVSVTAFSQAHEKGTLSFNAGFDGGVHGTVATARYQGSVIDYDTSAAVTTLFRFDGQYQIMNWLSAGFFLRTGKYIDDEDPANSDDNKVTDISIGVRGYAVNKDKFVMYVGAYYGLSRLYIKNVDAGFVAEYNWSGSNLSADIGFNWYFAKMVGLNFSLGYSTHKFDLQDYSFNGSPQNFSGWSHTFDTKGTHVVLGIAVKLLGD